MEPSNGPQTDPGFSARPKKPIPFLSVIIVALIALICYFAIPMVITMLEVQEHDKKRFQPNEVGTRTDATPPPGVVPLNTPSPSGPKASDKPKTEEKEADKPEGKPAEEKPADAQPADDKPAEDKPGA